MSATKVAPILSTPDTHVFGDPTPFIDVQSLPKLSDEQLHSQYEIHRTINEITVGGWKRIALQFPDEMLVDAPRVFEALSHGLEDARKRRKISHSSSEDGIENHDSGRNLVNYMGKLGIASEDLPEKVYILADTSYGACCVDEIAAEHVDADVVVHYGRACLSPTSRLPVIYVFTSKALDLEATTDTFIQTYPERDKKIVLMADIPYSHHLQQLYGLLQDEGYTNIFAPSIIHDPSSLLPNRTVPNDIKQDADKLHPYSLFHISEPPTSLLLTLSSRFESIYIYPTNSSSAFSLPSTRPPSRNETTNPQPLAPATTTPLLRRRYALLCTLPSVPIIGILIGTLSVRAYLPALQRIRQLIADVGKKSYTVVVGKVNAAKVANFAEVGAWVVVGCWESGLVDMKSGEGGGGRYWRPMVTPFELEVAFRGEAQRVWGGEWKGGFEGVGEEKGMGGGEERDGGVEGEDDGDGGEDGDEDRDSGSEEESAPPEFDLRTGRYISSARPVEMSSNKASNRGTKRGNGHAANALIKRATGDVARIGGEASPGAEFLRSMRTWQGLGSDFEIGYQEDGATVEEGRKGLARGYTVGDDDLRK